MSENTLQQDLTANSFSQGAFSFQLLFEEAVSLPSEDEFLDIMKKHIGNVSKGENPPEDTENDAIAIVANDYVAKFEDGELPVLLLTLGCTDTRAPLDEIKLSQMWDCPNSKEILEKSKYSITTADFFGSAIPDMKDRAKLLIDYLFGLLEAFPTCTAVLSPISGKLFTREALLNANVPLNDRFIYFTVNVRFFNIQDTDDVIVDTVGMGSLFLPDIQYHCKNVLDPNMIVGHAYSILNYIFENGDVIEDGQTVAGVDFNTGRINANSFWKCRHEDSLIQPLRPVLDINIDGYAAGVRHPNNT